jgi:hypothetical protein
MGRQVGRKKRNFTLGEGFNVDCQLVSLQRANVVLIKESRIFLSVGNWIDLANFLLGFQMDGKTEF